MYRIEDYLLKLPLVGIRRPDWDWTTLWKLGLPVSLHELDASREMLPKISETCVTGGGYKQIDAKDILAVLKDCY